MGLSLEILAQMSVPLVISLKVYEENRAEQYRGMSFAGFVAFGFVPGSDWLGMVGSSRLAYRFFLLRIFSAGPDR